jgi:hypothetical protein
MLGFATAVGVAYMAYRALLAMPEEPEATGRPKVESVRRHS